MTGHMATEIDTDAALQALAAAVNKLASIIAQLRGSPDPNKQVPDEVFSSIKQIADFANQVAGPP